MAVSIAGWGEPHPPPSFFESPYIMMFAPVAEQVIETRTKTKDLKGESSTWRSCLERRRFYAHAKFVYSQIWQ